jgi:hypothetical protein
MTSWPRFLTNSWFWTFAVLSAYWHIAEAIRPSNAPFFLLPCVLVTCLVVPIIWLIRYAWELYREHVADHEERKTWDKFWWEDHSRQHHWVHLYATDGYFTHQPDVNVRTRVISCVNCFQMRRIWDGSPLVNNREISWGCPKVPWTYRLAHGGAVPLWDVNSRPPWVR